MTKERYPGAKWGMPEAPAASGKASAVIRLLTSGRQELLGAQLSSLALFRFLPSARHPPCVAFTSAFH